MKRTYELINFMNEKGGAASSSDLLNEGFSAGLIASLERNGELERETRGVYVLPGFLLDDFAMISLRWRKCVISHGSALYLHGLAPRMPARIEVTLPREYNASGFAAENPSVIVHRANKKFYELGLGKTESPSGIVVNAYDPERCICDLVADRKTNEVDMQLFSHAIKTYFENSNGDIRKLSSYATAMGISDELKRYMEVFL